MGEACPEHPQVVDHVYDLSVTLVKTIGPRCSLHVKWLCEWGDRISNRTDAPPDELVCLSPMRNVTLLTDAEG
jgi:hypothetical protein